MDVHRRLDWLLPGWLEDVDAYSQSINEDIMSVVYTFVLNLIIFIAAFVTFSVYRRFNADVFAPKSKLMPNRTPEKLPNDTLFGWVQSLREIDDDTIVATSGYDVLFFIRFYRLCFKILSYSVIYCWLVLLPVNGLGKSSVYGYTPDAFDHWSMKNIDDDGGVLWFHLLGVCIFTGITIYHLEREYLVYAKYRHSYLRQTLAKQRTVLVQGIPHKMRSPDTLRVYFEALYPGTVLQVHLAQNLRHLERLIKQREQDVSDLERCLYLEHFHGDRPTVKVGNMQQEVDAIRHYKQSLNDLNVSVAKEQLIARKRAETKISLENCSSDNNSSSSPALSNAMVIGEFLKVTGMGNTGIRMNYTSRRKASLPLADVGGVTFSYQNSSSDEYSDKIKSHSADGSNNNNCGKSSRNPNSSSNNRFESLSMSVADNDSDEDEGIFFGFSGADSPQSPNNNNSSNRSRLRPFQVYQMSTSDWLRSIWTAPSLSECWRLIKQGRQGEDHEYYRRPHSHTHGYQIDDDEDEEHGLDSEEAAASSAVDEESDFGDKESLIKPPEVRRFFLSKAFVTFKSFAAASTARQVLHMQQAGRLTVSEAPEESDIIWNNMYTTRKGVLWIKFFFDMLVALLIVVWVAPVTLLSFVFSKDAITSRFQWVGVWCDESQIFCSVVVLLQPLAIVAIMNCLPPIMTAISVAEGSLTYSRTQFRAYHRYFAFQIVNVFLVTTLAGSVVDAVANIADNPEAWFSLLGSSLPKMGGFFLNFILVKAFTGLGMEIVRVAAVCCAILKMLLTPNITPRDRKTQALFGAARNMCNPGWFPYAKIYAQDMLTFTICATYACVAPLILIGGLCYFAIAAFIYKHQMLYVYEPVFETGGLWWPILARCFVLALIFAQSLMIGMMILKKSYQQVYFLMAIVVLTTSYYWYLSRTYEPLARQLPLDMAKAMDHQEDAEAALEAEEAAAAAAAAAANEETKQSTTDPASISVAVATASASPNYNAAATATASYKATDRYVHRSLVELRAASFQYMQPAMRVGSETPILEFDPDQPTQSNSSSKLAPV